MWTMWLLPPLGQSPTNLQAYEVWKNECYLLLMAAAVVLVVVEVVMVVAVVIVVAGCLLGMCLFPSRQCTDCVNAKK